MTAVVQPNRVVVQLGDIANRQWALTDYKASSSPDDHALCLYNPVRDEHVDGRVAWDVFSTVSMLNSWVIGGEKCIVTFDRTNRPDEFA